MQLVLDALEIVCQKRNTACTILHSDQGAQYNSNACQKLAKEKGIITAIPKKETALIMPSSNSPFPR